LTDHLVHRFFVRGTLHRADFGGAPRVVFNPQQRTSIKVPPWLEPDLRLIEKTLGVGFFYYGPHLWMVGEIEPLKSLERGDERGPVVQRILAEYPHRTISEAEVLYRIRLNPREPSSPGEYESPPEHLAGHDGREHGRLDSPGFPVLYGSQDLQICVHECRVTVEDEVFVATLSPSRTLRLLDLTEVLAEEVTPFESLDLAVHMLFLAGKHAYPISREVAIAAQELGYDGLIYPSYFSLIRTGARPFETIYGISIRQLPELAAHSKTHMIPNVGLFGRPIEQGNVAVKCINRLILERVEYNLLFGPADV
jgi:RES domain